MKLSKKDNLTDAIEALERNDDDTAPKTGNQQVVNNEGEIVTLGQKRDVKPSAPLKTNSLELSDKDLSEIKEIVASAVEKSLDKFLKNFRQNREK